MARPSRHLEALQILREHYQASGALPTIEVLAEKMGYKSTSSAHNAIQPLLKHGVITQDVQGGRFLPGPGFSTKSAYTELAGKGIGEFLEAGDPDTEVVEITNNSLEGEGVRKGDFLLISKSTDANVGDLLLIRNKRSFRIEPFTGTPPRRAPIGLVLAQFRKYRS